MNNPIYFVYHGTIASITIYRDICFSLTHIPFNFGFSHVQYYSLPDITIGGYDYTSIDELGNPTPVTMVLKEYKVAELNVINNSYVLDGNIIESKFPKAFYEIDSSMQCI